MTTDSQNPEPIDLGEKINLKYGVSKLLLGWWDNKRKANSPRTWESSPVDWGFGHG